MGGRGLFGAAIRVCCGVVLAGSAFAAAPLRPAIAREAAAPWPLDVREEWRRNVYGDGIGRAGLQAADIDADGSLEIVASANHGWDFWYVLRTDGAGGYPQVWASDDYSDWIGSLRLAQLDADPALEVVVGVGGDILIYDGATRELQQTLATQAGAVRGLTLTDVDRDGGVEAVFCDSQWEHNSLYVYDVISGSQEYAGAGQGGVDLAVGSVDDDPDLEIVIGRGTEPGLVVNGRTRAVEWTNPRGFGDFVRLGELDGDGRAEVVSGYRLSGISIFDVDLQSLSRSIPVEHGLDAVRLLDCDGDGALEIVHGDWDGGAIRAHDARTLALEWVITNAGFGVTDLALCDCDADGSREMLWGADAPDSAADRLYVASLVSFAIEWQSTDISGPFYALSHGDVDADGRPELLYGSFDSDAGYGDGLWFVHDAATKALEFQSGQTSKFGFRNLWRLRHADVDADPQQEIFATWDYPFDSTIFCFDGLTHAEQWHVTLPADGLVGALDLGDATGDGLPELVAVAGGSVYLLSPTTGATRWRSPTLGDSFFHLRLADVDGDSLLEIVTATHEGVFVVDRPAGTIRNLGDHDVSALDVVELDHDGHAEIVVGTTTGDLRILSPTGAIERTVAHYPAGVDGLDVADLTGDGVADYVVAVANEVSIRDGADGTTLWSSGRLRDDDFNRVGANDSLYVADIDGDSRSEIVVNVGTIGLRVYEVPNSHDLSLTAIDAPDPSLVGDEVAYTFTIANRGPLVATGVSLVVTVPASASFVSASLPGCSHVAPFVTCALGTLAAEASKAVAVVLRAGAAGALTVSGSVTGTGIDADPSDNTASATTTITENVIADLGLAKDDGQVFAAPGQPITYRLTVRNAGPWPVSSLTLTDALPGALQSPVFTPQIGSYDPASGAWTALDLVAGQSAVLELTATVDPAASGFLTNTASVATPAGTDDPQLGDNTAAHTDTVGVHLGELAHGSSLRAAPNASGEAYFWMQQAPRSSYEVLIDEIAGDLGSSAELHLQRLGADAATVLGEADPIGLGSSRSLRWQNAGGAVVADQLIRVRIANCLDDCQVRFRLRAYETTGRSPRFNDATGQASVLVLQNDGVSAASGTIWFWGPNGVLLASREFSDLAPHAQLALSTSTVPGLAGQAGSITITHDTSYGSLAGKVFAFEPATGFSFDTPIVMRPK